MVAIGRWTAFLQCSVALEGENEQTAAEGREVTVAVSVLTSICYVFRASSIKVSKRLQMTGVMVAIGHWSAFLQVLRGP